MRRDALLYMGMLLVGLWSGQLGVWVSAQDEARKEAAAPSPHLLKGAIDPFITGLERALFLKAAGVDTELDHSEFGTNKKVEGGFVRSYERFSTLLLFDKNRDKKIDWFEANAYRLALRAAVLGAYDKDKNRRLTATERDEAIKALGAGKLPRIATPKSGSSNIESDLGPGAAPPSRPSPNAKPSQKNRQFTNSPEDRRREWEQLQSKLAEKYDRDGNGRLNTREEWQAARQEIREYYSQREIERYDKDGDGQVSDEERRAGRERDQQAELRRRADRDRDGQLDGAEQTAYDESLRQARDKQAHDEQARKNFMNRFDKDGDGDLNESERQAVGPYYQALREKVNKTAIELYDSNGDGQLNAEEKAAGMTQFNKQVMEKYDSDGDGELNLKERAEAMRREPQESERLYFLYLALQGQGGQRREGGGR